MSLADEMRELTELNTAFRKQREEEHLVYEVNRVLKAARDAATLGYRCASTTEYYTSGRSKEVIHRLVGYGFDARYSQHRFIVRW